MVQLLTVACMSSVQSNKGKGMQSSSEQPLVGEERYVTTRITAAKETNPDRDTFEFDQGHVTKNQPITMLVLPSESLGI